MLVIFPTLTSLISRKAITAMHYDARANGLQNACQQSSVDACASFGIELDLCFSSKTRVTGGSTSV